MAGQKTPLRVQESLRHMVKIQISDPKSLWISLELYGYLLVLYGCSPVHTFPVSRFSLSVSRLGRKHPVDTTCSFIQIYAAVKMFKYEKI